MFFFNIREFKSSRLDFKSEEWLFEIQVPTKLSGMAQYYDCTVKGFFMVLKIGHFEK
jgi:hypothetical protein